MSEDELENEVFFDDEDSDDDDDADANAKTEDLEDDGADSSGAARTA